MQRCAELEVIADFARTDPDCDAVTVVRLANVAHRARRDLEQLRERNAEEDEPGLDSPIDWRATQ